MKQMARILLGCCLVSESLMAAALPPLGQRRYRLDRISPERPADIEALSETPPAKEGVIMRDPIRLKGATAKPTKAWKEPERVVAQSSLIKFEKFAVDGRYSVPRVTFERVRKEPRHAQEPKPVDYRKKVIESESMLDGLDW